MTPLAALRLPAPFTWPRSRFVLEAAVAVVLRGERVADAEVLLVRRASRAGDPWSGDMAFPGGRRAPDDVDLRATAIRETAEEVGLTLGPAVPLLGRLRQVVTIAPSHQRMRPMLVSPFVFALGPGEATTLTPSVEVVGTRWVPLAALLDPAHRALRPWRVFGAKWGVTLPAPAWRLGDDVVWGLTHQMLRSLLGAITRTRG